VTVFVHWVIHFFGCDYGAAYGVWVPYDFWSGVSGSFLVGVTVFTVTWYVHRTCHDSWKCWRIGRYQAAGGTFKLCRHHHPDMRGQRPGRELIGQLHREWKEACGWTPGSS
jgi:hypothetical protein